MYENIHFICTNANAKNSVKKQNIKNPKDILDHVDILFCYKQMKNITIMKLLISTLIFI